MYCLVIVPLLCCWATILMDSRVARKFPSLSIYLRVFRFITSATKLHSEVASRNYRQKWSCIMSGTDRVTIVRRECSLCLYVGISTETKGGKDTALLSLYFYWLLLLILPCMCVAKCVVKEISFFYLHSGMMKTGLNAVMGPTGSGKTTWVMIIAVCKYFRIPMSVYLFDQRL